MKKVPLLLQILGKYKHMEAFEHIFFRALFPDSTCVKVQNKNIYFYKVAELNTKMLQVYQTGLLREIQAIMTLYLASLITGLKHLK